MKTRFRAGPLAGPSAQFLTAAVVLLCCHGALAKQNFHPKAPATKYSDWFQAASHNTYYNKFRGKGADWAKVLDYTSAIEFDVWAYDGWKVYHNVAGESYCNDHLNECLKQVRTWHDQHKGHDPITIFLEMKSTEGFRVWDLNGLLCGPTRGSQANGRGANDAIFACNELYRPMDLIGKHASLRAAAQAGAWPSLAKLKGKIIFVINSGYASIAEKYLREARLTRTPNDDRGEASAFVMAAASSEGDITGVPQELSGYDHSLARHVVFYNGECGSWNATLGTLIHANNYLSRGYYCGNNNDPGGFDDKWIGADMINFVAYDIIEYAYGLTTPKQSWNGGYPQGDFRGGPWQTIPDQAQSGKADWKNRVMEKQGVSVGEAIAMAQGNPQIGFFFYMKGGPMELTGKGRFAPRTAVFFSGTPQMGEAKGYADLYVKRK